MGGIALGNGVKSSGLMDTMDDIILRMLEGRQLWSVVVMLSVIVLVCPVCVSPSVVAHSVCLSPLS